MTDQTKQADDHPRQPDIEVYIKECSIEEIISWLGSVFNDVNTHGPLDKPSINVTCSTANNSIPLTIYTGAAGKLYTSLWFQSEHTPWKTDLDCAMAMANALGNEVRCATDSWQESEDSDNQWWKITREGKTMVSW
ncbi:hypothetical protein [Alkalimarinus sediminis]|uniref:Uncharacterized protein n=1 Tax=Alkalimarinus sediminis TaxID=1632866 RepID=A0A9E8KPE2_9ALTE|nr:hypothetical protein [Alkalimarinus sediminis]UZW73402.1 hypothetical protein NNL22_10095 [Alkalimarinus sediminis]